MAYKILNVGSVEIRNSSSARAEKKMLNKNIQEKSLEINNKHKNEFSSKIYLVRYAKIFFEN